MSSHPVVSLVQYLLAILNFSYSEECYSDIVRKSLGYVPVLWTLIDDYYAGSRGSKKNSWTRLMSSQGRYLVLLDLVISCFADHVFTAITITIAVGIASIAWMKFGQAQWSSKGYLTVVFPGMGKGGPKEVRLLVLMLCTLMSAFCFAVKFESKQLALAALISFYVLYSFVVEKGFALALSGLTFNWPMLILAMTEKYPITASMRSSSISITGKQAAK